MTNVSAVLISLITLALLGYIIGLALLPPTDRHVALFAAAYETPLTETNTPIIRHAIRWGRCWRTGGAIVLLVVGEIVGTSTRFDLPAVMLLAVGYGAGAIIGEIARRPIRSGPQRASLRVRTLNEYVQPWLLGIVGVTLLLAATGLVVGIIDRLRYDDGVNVPADGFLLRNDEVVGLVVALVVAAVALVMARVAVVRPQPTVAPDVDAAQHAIRSAAIVSLTGVTLLCGAVGLYGSVETKTLHNLNGASGFGVAVAVVVGLLGITLSLRSIPRVAPFRRGLGGVPA